MKIKKKLIPLLIFFMALIAFDKVNAEDDVLRELQEKYGQKEGVNAGNSSAAFSYLSIYNAKIISNDGNEFKFGLDIYNAKKYQPQVTYAVMLYRQEGENKPEVADYKIYGDDVFGIKENETVHKEIFYDSPASLNGKYRVNLEIKSSSGFGIAYFPLGEVEVKGSTDGQSGEFSQETIKPYANYENFYLINYLLDTDTYSVGDSANISVFWGANPSIEKEQLNGTSLKVTLKDGNGQLCAPEATGQLEKEKMPEHALVFAINKDCVNPIAEAQILDKSGNVLASNISKKDIKKESENVSISEVEKTDRSWFYEGMKNGILKYIMLVTIAVIVLLIGLFVAKKRKVLLSIVAMFAIVSVSMFATKEVSAYTFGGPTGIFTVNMDKACYTPSSSVTVNSTIIGSWAFMDCEFWHGLYAKYFPTGEERTIRTYFPACGSVPYSYSTAFAAPATAGTYQIGFNGWANGISYPTPASYDVHKLSFTVGNLANGVCGASNGGSFPSAPSSGLCSSGTATSVVPVYSGGGGGSGTGSGTIIGWSWSCLGSCGGTNASCSATKSYSCTGTIPANAASYDAEESTGLAADTAWTYSATDTATKCQFGCGSGYSWNGSACVATCTYSDHSCVYTPSIDCSNSSNCGLTGSNVASCYAIDSCTGNTVVRPLSECAGGSGTCSNTTITCPACPTGLEGYKEVAP